MVKSALDIRDLLIRAGNSQNFFVQNSKFPEATLARNCNFDLPAEFGLSD